MEKKPTEIKSLKKGGYVIIDDVPCTVASLDISRPGKHGAAKAR
ncbi:MAG: translation initiation factor IF-5A, partial [Candidatus Aenigmarchaeota archaeon]|nr:translation initiation factor IF-5A [Candidatus Aenigmarchaeota archaeon]